MQRIPQLVAAILIPCLTGCIGISTHLDTDARTDTSDKSTKAEVRTNLGSPDRVESKDGSDIWWYNRGVAWRGVVLWVVVVPIPLMAPVGMNHAKVSFRGNTVESRYYETGATWSYYGCVIFLFCGHLPHPISLR